MKQLGMLVVALLLASCATRPPARQSLEAVEVPGQWATEGPAGGVTDRWWESFGSSALNAVVREAFTNNFDIRVAGARLDAAIAQAGIEGAAQTPQFGLDFDARRGKQNFIGLPIPGSGGEVLSTRSTTYGAGLMAAWELDLWGRVRSGVRASLAEVQASEADLGAARQYRRPSREGVAGRD